ncbi:NusB antitermination factor [Solidesulfovibrio carbinoliphilus subsp. oakridgensis]|uniref:Transcription antitermination protein NusB n=2 Tax=Solidesulfovibrio carbinoliphilus TaxID=345370 RepID=G7QAF1_9BACT|nr:NusB antitermination factor [Solidesulfovibrio carbinoliphilus subsp. oakridgensis]
MPAVAKSIMPESEDKKPVASRRKARKQAFECLYGLIFESAADERSLRRVFARCPHDVMEGEDGAGQAFAWELVQGVWQNQRELDALIVKFSKNWKLSRIAKVELTILRLALYEILHRSDIPLRVALNEAIELAKRYGDENSRNFINGILDAVAKAVDSGEFEIHKDL